MNRPSYVRRRDFLQSVAAAGAVGSIPSLLSSAAAAKESASRVRPEVVAIYCPLWHRYDRMDAWKGYGWCEWELVKAARPRFPFAKPHYPYLHVVVGNTPRRFGRLAKAAGEFVAGDPKRPPAILVNAWNEWTEGSFLLPEERYGTAYLKALKEALGRGGSATCRKFLDDGGVL